MTENVGDDMLSAIHRHELPSSPGFLSAVIQDGPWKGYTMGEAMAASYLQGAKGPQK